MKRLLYYLLLMIVMSMASLQSYGEVSLVAQGYKAVSLKLKTGTYDYTNTQFLGKTGGYRSMVNKGSIIYSEEDKTLTLSHAELLATINVFNQDLTIRVDGKNDIKDANLEDLQFSTGIRAYNILQHDLTIEGVHAYSVDPTDVLTISLTKSTASPRGIYLDATNLYVRGCGLKINAMRGITGNYSNHLYVDLADVTVTGESSYGAITSVMDVTLTNCHYDDNRYQILRKDGELGVYVVDGDNETLASKVNIIMTRPQLTKTSVLWCCGQLIDLEKDADYDVPKGSGTMHYDARSQTLTMNSVKYDRIGTLFNSRDFDLNIDLKGNNVIRGGMGMWIQNTQYHNVSITSSDGKGSLSITATGDGPGLLLDSTAFTISNCSVDIAGNSGIYGVINNNKPTSDLNIDRATVTAVGATYVTSDKVFSVNGLRSINLTKTSLYDVDACIKKDDKGAYGVYRSGNDHLVTSRVVFQPGHVNVGDNLLKSGTYTSSNLTGLTKGTLTYDEDNNLLTLNNVTLNADISFSHKAMNVYLIGKNTITSSGIPCITAMNNANQPVSIHSQYVTSGSLTLNSAGNAAMYTYYAPVYISTCQLNLNTEVEGTCGIKANNATYTIDRAIVKAKGSNYSIYGVRNLMYDGCTITPAGAHVISNGVSMLCDSDNKAITSLVTIQPETYGITVAGVQVTADNCNNVLGDNKVEYNPDTKTLTLWDGAVLNSPASSTEDEPSVIRANQDLTIALGGTVAVNQAYNHLRSTAIYLEGDHNYAITRTGTVKTPVMNVKSTSLGIYVDSKSRLDISYCTVNVKNIDGKTSLRMGIAGSETSKLVIKDATVNVFCNSNLITNFASVILKNVHTDTEGETYDTTKKTFVEADGTAVTTSLLIRPDEYNFRVGGVLVTALNSDDVLGDGKVQYIAESNTLMLTGADIEGKDKNYGLFINQDLNIFISGVNSITSKTNGIYINSGNNVTITGSQNNGCELYVTSTDDTGIISRGNLVVDHCIMSVTGTSGIQGKSSGTLNVYQSTLVAYSTAEYGGVPVNGFEKQNLTDESIVQPANCRWATTGGEGYCVVDSDYKAVRGLVAFNQKNKAVDVKLLAHIIGVLNGSKTETAADDVNGDGVVDLSDIKAAKDEILNTPNAGEATVSNTTKYDDVTYTVIYDADWVQLWAGGPKWATKNVGATSTNLIGNKYYYGQTAAATFYTGTEDIQGTEYDTATEAWGGQWQMPTQQDYQQLINCCTRQWTCQSGVWGYLFRGKGRYADCTVFFPAAGHGNSEVGVKGYYWSSTPVATRANIIFFDSDNVSVNEYRRNGACSVRPICKP